MTTFALIVAFYLVITMPAAVLLCLALKRWAR